MSFYRILLPEPYYDRYGRRGVIVQSMLTNNLVNHVDSQISIQIDEKNLVKYLIKEDLPIR
jgi:hypothetical protein